MKAWRLERVRGAWALKDVAMLELRPGSVPTGVEASTLLSYLRA